MQEKEFSPLVEPGTGCRCYTYFVVVSGRLWSLIATAWWGTLKEMRYTAGGMCQTAKIFRHSAAVAVYELWDDNCYHLVHTCGMCGTHELPASFYRHECPAPRRQNVK